MLTSPPTTARVNRAAHSIKSCLVLRVGDENDGLGERKENDPPDGRELKGDLGESEENRSLGDRAPTLVFRRDVDRYILTSGDFPRCTRFQFYEFYIYIYLYFYILYS